MSLINQIAKASFVLTLGALIHIAILFQGAAALIGTSWMDPSQSWAIPATLTFLIVLAAHTVNVWLWACVLLWVRALETLEAAVYFALVTTTTLGYGDVVLHRRWRIFGAMAAVSGLMTFGLSTAFLVAIVQILFEARLG